MKENYVEIIRHAVAAYSDEHIRSYFQNNLDNGLLEHGFPRLTVNLGFLICRGIRTDLTDLWYDMMDFCCEHAAMPKVCRGTGNDFSVKELVFGILEAEKSGVVPQERTQKWRDSLSKLDPYASYSCIAASPTDKIANWAAHVASSEYMRKYIGMEISEKFLETQVATQLLSFDESGMYIDPNAPMVYDIVTRMQFGVMMFHGYRGEHFAALEEHLNKAAPLFLYFQSVNGDLPFGGRSNQFLHNEAWLAAAFEYEATRSMRAGDAKMASVYKGAAALATQSILKDLQRPRCSHLKNQFPIESKYGCEGYAYFDKYMVTLGSIIYMAYLFADDSIPEGICPAMESGWIRKTTDTFHKVFMNRNGYFLEFDLNADPHYDSNGLGRVHYRGAPCPLALSAPFTTTPNFELGMKNPWAVSLCSVHFHADGTLHTGASPECTYRLCAEENDEHHSLVRLECRYPDGVCLEEIHEIDDAGVHIRVRGEGKVGLMLPAYDFDGLNHTQIQAEEKAVEVCTEGWCCRYESNHAVCDLNETLGNRNGHYRAFCTSGEREVEVTIRIFQK